MRAYNIVPEFRYCRYFPVLAMIYQFIAVGFVFWGHFIDSTGFILAVLFQFCALYYLILYICSKNYRLEFIPNSITIWNIFNKSKKYQTDSIQWRIRKIPWYNSYFIYLYSHRRIPIAIVKPHWKNAPMLTRFLHLGKITPTEQKYLNFLKNVGLL